MLLSICMHKVTAFETPMSSIVLYNFTTIIFEIHFVTVSLHQGKVPGNSVGVSFKKFRIYQHFGPTPYVCLV